MKTAIIPASLINAGPAHRMDAAYWVRVAEQAKAKRVSLSDTVAMRQIQFDYAVLYPGRVRCGSKPGLGELVEQAQQNAEELVPCKP